ncbi:hypothetical protein [Hydrogenophilus thermoluteolus]|uniref:Uncharacterized protein n=1 Tax=Hydrogenophilus thermoluteolus TaxID=297 RepID=A0A2Z6DY26_HYDTE|nr:hypothetical protein [Hydrogenophilus thermoluteolus]BBD77404.1 hypothetical protein HPTL_1140 [Hydrogenophilus thermoluteolus]
MIEFLPAVPQAVREGIEAIFSGRNGLDFWVAERGRQLAEAQAAFAHAVKTGDTRIDEFRRAMNKAREAFASCQSEREKLIRLVTHPEMAKVYSLLADSLSEEEQARFILAAWDAQIDFGSVKGTRAKAKELAAEIADKAKELAALMHEFKSLGFGVVQYEQIERIEKIADTFATWRPLHGNIVIDAATTTRQISHKQTYLRAFIALLAEKVGISFTPKIIRAIAITAEVAIDDPDVTVTPREVRHAIKNWENSREKF